MAPPSFVKTAKSPSTSDGGGVFEPPPHYGRDGDGERGGGPPDYRQRLRRARLGLTFAMAPILMLFLTFTAAFVIRHRSSTFDPSTNAYIDNWIKVSLPTGLLLINTLVLLLSSFTIEMARQRMAGDVALSPVQSIPGVLTGRERGFPWLVVTALLGITFLCGQGLAWRELLAKGFYLSSGASSALVYLLTATHAVHLAGGILVLLYALLVYFLHRPVESRHIVVDITAWYWHFMFLLWIYIFSLLQFAR